MPELSTLLIKVDATGAIKSVENLTAGLDKNVKAAKQSEAAALALGKSWREQSAALGGFNAAQEKAGGLMMRFAVAEREAHREAERMTAAIRAASREMSQQQASVIQSELGLRRFAAAEREAYAVQAQMEAASKRTAASVLALGTASGISGRQMAVAAARSTALASAMSAGAMSAGGLASKATAAGIALGSAFGPAGIAAVAVIGFAGMIRNIGNAAKEAAEETRKSLDEIAKAIDTAPAMAKLRELWHGTRGLDGSLSGGIVQTRARLKALGPLENIPVMGASNVARRQEIGRLTTELALLESQFASLKSLVDNWTAMPNTGPLSAVTINASREAVVNLTGAILDARMAWEGNILNRNRGVAKSVPGQPSTGDPLATINLGGISPHPFWRGIGKGDGPQADEFTEAFAENFSRAMGDAIGRAFTGNLRSGADFSDAISGALGQAISGRVSKGIAGRLGNVSTGDLLGVGAVLSVLNLFAGSVKEHTQATRALQEATANLRSSVSQSRDNVAQWVAGATASPEQQAMMGSQATAAGFVNDIFSQFGARSAPGSNNRYRYDTLRSTFGTIDFDEIESFLTSFKTFASAEDLQRINEVLDAYRSVIAAQVQSARLAAADTIGDYRKSLTLSQFSPLSPTAQLAEARAEFSRLQKLAMGGDATAAGQLVGASQTLLGLSRQVNASGGRYVADFNNQRDVLRIVEDSLRAQAEQAAQIQVTIVNNTARANEIAGTAALDNNARLDAIAEQVAELVRLTKELAVLT
jgi:hypothetical protein